MRQRTLVVAEGVDEHSRTYRPTWRVVDPVGAVSRRGTVAAAATIEKPVVLVVDGERLEVEHDRMLAYWIDRDNIERLAWNVCPHTQPRRSAVAIRASRRSTTLQCATQ
jgi:hypothetical protein